MRTLREGFLARCAQTSPSPLLIEVERADGVYLYSAQGKRYFDLISGVSVSNVGHNNGSVIEAVQRQAASYMHTMVYGEMILRPQVRYAELICSYLPPALDNVYFVCSGAEAIEGALKLARAWSGRSELISMRGAYHGSTMGALSVQGEEDYKTAFRPLLPATQRIRFNSIEDLSLITTATACVLTEIVQGEAGIRLPEKGYLQALRRRCDEVGALMIVDEIQTGFGRCGDMFAITKYGVMPDILCLAKALGGGMPLGAFIASKKVMDVLSTSPALGHISTFAGHPVCCAAGAAALDYIAANELVSKAELMGELFEKLLSAHPAVVEIRRSGLLMAVEVGSSEKLYAIMERFKDVGIMSDWFLFCDTAFRISPPLTITDSEVGEVCRLILTALN